MGNLNDVNLGMQFVRGMQEDWRHEALARQDQAVEWTARASLIDRIRLAIAEEPIAYGTRLKAHAAPAHANR